MTHHPITSPCECEHIDHFDDVGGAIECHEYGDEVDVEQLTAVHTMFGVFTICAECRRAHVTDDMLEGSDR